MPAKKLKEFLDASKIKYVSISHSSAYTAMEIAAMAHVPGKDLAKTVMIKINGHMAMAVLPATHMIKMDLLKKVVGNENIRLATEQEFKDKFPDCEVGAMPPFGNLYGMEVYASSALKDDEEIVFNAGSHTELIKVSYKDFERLVNPKVAEISYKTKL
ncbi:MAG: YbaK/EbsC family protein [Ignavibacteriaceae bacterium]|nr:YbaK/EbsC family protein [Ignavibacteriaceae bacterium]